MPVTVLHGGDAYGMDRYVDSQIRRLVPEGQRPWNVDRFDLRVPAERFRGWETGRMAPWAADNRVVVFDHLDAVDKFKGSGRFEATEEQLTPTEKGNRLQALNATAAAVEFAAKRTSGVHLICLVHGSLVAGSSAVASAVSAARSAGGQVLEFSKSAFYDRDGRTAEVQRVAEGLGLLLEDEVAAVISYQLGEDQDGHLVASEVRKLLLWQAETGQELTVASVGELCSTGRITPVEWATAVVTRSKGRRALMVMTETLIDQGFELMELLGVLLPRATTAYVFKTLDALEANEGEIAQVLGWPNPRRVYPYRREHVRSTIKALRATCESCLRWQEKVRQEGLIGLSGEELRLLASELLGELDPFELRELAG